MQGTSYTPIDRGPGGFTPDSEFFPPGSAGHFRLRERCSVEERDKEPATEEREKKLEELRQGLNDIRQGLVTIRDYYSLFATVSQTRCRDLCDGTSVALPTIEERGEFESLWHFLSDREPGDARFPGPSETLYSEYTEFCRKRGLEPVERDAFDFILMTEGKNGEAGA